MEHELEHSLSQSIVSMKVLLLLTWRWRPSPCLPTPAPSHRLLGTQVLLPVLSKDGGSEPRADGASSQREGWSPERREHLGEVFSHFAFLEARC